MREQIIRLLDELDAELARTAGQGERLDLYLVGRSSLILRLDLAGYQTDDVDIVQMSTTRNLENLEETAIKLFGKTSANAARLGLYLERVPQGLPPLPHGFRKRCTELPGAWQVICPRVLEFHDFAATKLKRFAAKDREDLKLLCDYGYITATGLRESLNNAFAFAAGEEEDPGRKRAYESLRVVCAYLETGQPSF
jgi:hypothetical protein